MGVIKNNTIQKLPEWTSCSPEEVAFGAVSSVLFNWSLAGATVAGLLWLFNFDNSTNIALYCAVVLFAVLLISRLYFTWRHEYRVRLKELAVEGKARPLQSVKLLPSQPLAVTEGLSGIRVFVPLEFDGVPLTRALKFVIAMAVTGFALLLWAWLAGSSVLITVFLIVILFLLLWKSVTLWGRIQSEGQPIVYGEGRAFSPGEKVHLLVYVDKEFVDSVLRINLLHRQIDNSGDELNTYCLRSEHLIRRKRLNIENDISAVNFTFILPDDWPKDEWRSPNKEFTSIALQFRTTSGKFRTLLYRLRVN